VLVRADVGRAEQFRTWLEVVEEVRVRFALAEAIDIHDSSYYSTIEDSREMILM